MSTIPLFQGDESVEDLCLLIKSLHEEMSTMHRKVDVLLAIKTDNTDALREMVASGPSLEVVPNEDEATPVVEPVVEPVTSPRKKPTFWSKQCPIAKAHNSIVQSSRKMQRLLKAKLATKLSPSERAAVESRLAAEQKLEREHKGYYNDQLKVLGYVHPNKAKRAAAKTAK